MMDLTCSFISSSEHPIALWTSNNLWTESILCGQSFAANNFVANLHSTTLLTIKICELIHSTSCWNTYLLSHIFEILLNYSKWRKRVYKLLMLVSMWFTDPSGRGMFFTRSGLNEIRDAVPEFPRNEIAWSILRDESLTALEVDKPTTHCANIAFTSLTYIG